MLLELVPICLLQGRVLILRAQRGFSGGGLVTSREKGGRKHGLGISERGMLLLPLLLHLPGLLLCIQTHPSSLLGDTLGVLLLISIGRLLIASFRDRGSSRSLCKEWPSIRIQLRHLPCHCSIKLISLWRQACAPVVMVLVLLSVTRVCLRRWCTAAGCYLAGIGRLGCLSLTCCLLSTCIGALLLLSHSLCQV